jgi:hypothetical protein
MLTFAWRTRTELVSNQDPSFERTHHSLVASDLLAAAVYENGHRVTGFQGRMEKLLVAIDADPETAATPVNFKFQNFRVLQLDGSFGLKAISSLCNDNPAKPKTAVSHVPPRAAMCSPPAIAVWLSARSMATVSWKYRSASSESPSRAATSPCMAPLRELPWPQRGS